MKLEPIIQSEVSQKEKHQYSIPTHIHGIQKDGNNNPVYETAKETLMYRTVSWTLWERERVGRPGKMALKHVEHHARNESPIQVRCMTFHHVSYSCPRACNISTCSSFLLDSVLKFFIYIELECFLLSLFPGI